MYKISDKMIKFITEATKNWNVELTVGKKNFSSGKYLQRHLPGRLTSFLFVIEMGPLSYILSKCIEGENFTKSPEKINQVMYMDNLKLFAKNENNVTHKVIVNKSYIYIYIYIYICVCVCVCVCVNMIWLYIIYKGLYTIKLIQLSNIKQNT